MRSPNSWAALALATLALATSALSAAEDGASVPPPVADPAGASSDSTITPPPGQRALTKEDAEAWLDGFMPYALGTGDIAGAVVVIVKDGSVLLQKGYGYADVATKKPVDPATTLFRPGSVSKLITWTAVMQQVERGKLDLDADVNGYIDFEIPARDGKPITLRNILTHTPGFEEQAKGIMGLEEDGVIALDAHLKRWVPTRLFAPGTTPAYSNYATALAGYIVGRSAGMSFDDYVDQNIFAPLDMKFSTFRQPLPEHLKAHMASGYALASQPAKPFEIVGPAPAGSMSASGADMAKFMIAHLQKGAYGEQRILSEATAQTMHTTALTILPRVHRMMLGFYETNYNGRRVISHGGDTLWFHSYLHLFLEDNIGLFVSVNSAGKEGASGDIRTALYQQFADRYLPGPAPEGQVDPAMAAEHARQIAGSYDNSRRMQTSFLSLLNLVGAIKVSANEDNTISVAMATDLAGVPMKWREIEPYVWRAVDGELLLSAQAENGRIVRFSFDGLSPFMVFEPVPASRSAGWLLPSLIVAVLALAGTMLAWPISALTRRHYRVAYSLSGVDARAHRWVRIGATVAVVWLIAWVWTVSAMMSNFNLLTPGTDTWLWILQLTSFVVFVGAAAAALWNASVVLRSGRRWYAKTWAVVLALSGLVVLWTAFTFHLIAFDVNY